MLRRVDGRGLPVIAPLPTIFAHTSISRTNSRRALLEFLTVWLPQGSGRQDGKTHSLGAFQYVTPKVRREHELTLSDFKSYKGHHVLLFGDAYFTSIIGPNGSGKSNS
jgi:hypothetical protein